MTRRKGFTLVELMVVILIVGILAAVAIPLMSGRIEKAKWSEANAAAGTIRSAIRAYAAETSYATANGLEGKALNDATTQSVLGFTTADLTGTYFIPACYTISSIDDTTGIAVITVDSSKSDKTDKPSGSYELAADGKWTKKS